jgi:DnaA-homolog protein
MQQLLLNLDLHRPPSLSGFVTGRNAELLAALREVEARLPRERFLYLWGEHGAGKTHLLQAVAANQDVFISVSKDTRIDAALSDAPLVAVDGVDSLSKAGAIDLFNVYNGMRETGGVLLASGPCPPARLKLRPDLRTRLGWGLVFQVHTLTDEEKIAALQAHAKERGFNLGHEVGQYLLTHWRRDMLSLFAALEALDKYSLELKRPITLPLLREALKLLPP